MDDNARNDATGRPISLNNESTPDTVVFSGAAPNPTSGAASGGGLYFSEDEEEEWCKISYRKFTPDPVLPLDISPLSWEDRDVIAKSTHHIFFPSNVMEYLVFYIKVM